MLPGGRMFGVPIEWRGTERAQWLADLAAALEEASLLLANATIGASDLAEARDLFARIEAARFEARALQRSRATVPQHELSPEWSYPPVWLHPRLEG